MHVEHVEARHAVLSHVAAAALDVHVAAAAEGLVSGAGQRHHAYVGRFAADAQGVAHFGNRGGREGVAPVRPVDGDSGNAVVKVEENVFIFPYAGPLSVAHGLFLCVMRLVTRQVETSRPSSSTMSTFHT